MMDDWLLELSRIQREALCRALRDAKRRQDAQQGEAFKEPTHVLPHTTV